MAGMKLSERTQHLLRNRPKPLTYAKMSDDLAGMDGTITVAWLHSFAVGRLQCVDCDRVQLVYEYLTGVPLQID